MKLCVASFEPVRGFCVRTQRYAEVRKNIKRTPLCFPTEQRKEAETRALFGHFRAVPLCHGRAPGADARPDAFGCTTTRGTPSA